MNAYMRWAPDEYRLDTEEGVAQWQKFWDWVHRPPLPGRG